ncbi:MAG TPA: hypothetical protein P5321_08825 [Thermotogota bacterium]|mgnify:FL=1|nr:hypothetical protein [Thermotogota bacterium]
MLKTAMVVGGGHPYFDKRVYLKCVEPLSKICKEVIYVSARKRTGQYEVPDNVVDVFVDNMPIRTVKRTIFWDRVHREVILSQEPPIDLIILHDIPIGYVFPNRYVRKLKDKYQSKIIIDLHEYLPETLFPSVPENSLITNINDKMIVDPYIREADGYVVVSEHGRDYLLKKGIPETNILKSPNYAHSIPNVYGEKTNAIGFVGRLVRQNGPNAIARMARIVVEKYGLEFRFIGTDKDAVTGLFDDNWILHNEKVSFFGMLPYENMLQEISKLKFVISHLEISAKNSIYSLTNKFFDSLVSKTPIIVPSQLIEQRSILEEYDIGYYLDLEKSQWTDDLEKIFRDQKEYDRKVSNIAKHYREFLWETHESEYLDFIKRISKGE